jgi:hypothetical protein
MRPLPVLTSTATCVLLTSFALAGPPERFRLDRPDWPRQEDTATSRPRVEEQEKTVQRLPPEELDDDGGAPPEGYVRIRRTSPGTTTAGGFIFTIAYAPAFYLGVLGATCDPEPFDDSCAGRDELAPLLIPVCGPLAAIPNCRDTAICGAIFVAVRKLLLESLASTEPAK